MWGERCQVGSSENWNTLIFLPASWSLSISWSPGLVSHTLTFISPSPKKDNMGKTLR